MTPEQQKAFDDAFDLLQSAHDDMDRQIRDVWEFSTSGDIGWNQGSELGAIASDMRSRWKKIQEAITALYPLRTQE